MPDRTSLEDRLGHRFKDSALVDLALTHRSMNADEGADGPVATNERLEFLGDRVLGLAIANLLFETFPEEAEGNMARRFAALVSAKALSRIAEDIDLAPHVQFGAGPAVGSSIVSDACEALIGAVYLDAGFEAASAVIVRHWQPLMDGAIDPPKDAKTTLQEWAQGRGLLLPDYQLVESSGPDHAPQFTMSVTVEGYSSAVGTDSSKRAATQAAAKAFLETLA